MSYYPDSNSFPPDEPEETVARPSLARQLAPYVFAGLILVYMFYKVDFSRVWDILTRDDIHHFLIVGAYLVYCAVYYFTDILSFHHAYNRFNAAIGFLETARLRFASYTVQAVNGAITEVMAVLYMRRVKKVPVLSSSSSAAFVYFNETYTMVALLSYCAFLLPEKNRIVIEIPHIGVTFWGLLQGAIVLAWIVLPLWLVFFRTRLGTFFGRLYNAEVLLAFREARLRDYAAVFGYRFGNNVINVLMNIVILKAMGIDAPLPLLFAAVPFMVNVAYWPISVGGFGGPQLVADFLLKGYATEETVFAYSLIWSALFFLTRTLSGLPFLRPVYRAAFPTTSPAKDIEVEARPD
ncbi:MAG: lysylphosphatidylglycerol synthase transmembrane domain-containing protein [bacterium]